MTEKDVKKLSRLELLDILVEQGKENDQLKLELEDLKKELAARNIVVQNSGTLAEAALGLAEVFEKADEAAEIYLINVKRELFEKADRAAAEYLEKLKKEMDEKAGKLLEEYETSLKKQHEEIEER